MHKRKKKGNSAKRDEEIQLYTMRMESLSYKRDKREI